MGNPEVFLSYSTLDKTACDHIEEALMVANCTVWRDARSIKPGSSWVKSIFQGLSSADFVVPLLSVNSLRSPWVHKEVETALIKSLTRDSPLSIVPAILEPVQVPDELIALQCIDLSEDFPTCINALVKHICGLTFVPPNDSDGNSEYSASIAKVGDSLFRAIELSKGIPDPSQLELWQLHQHLVRLQGIVEQIANMSASDADDLWHIAGNMMPNPIPGAQEVSNQINMSLNRVSGDEKLKMSLVSRYISIMGDIVKSVRSSVLLAIPITNPDIADQLTRLFQSKVSIYRSVQRLRDVDEQQVDCVSDDLLDYIEAARTLEHQGLLQLIDADARSVAQKGLAGRTVFMEIATDGVTILKAIIDLRQRIGGLLKSIDFDPRGCNVA